MPGAQLVFRWSFRKPGKIAVAEGCMTRGRSVAQQREWVVQNMDLV